MSPVSGACRIDVWCTKCLSAVRCLQDPHVHLKNLKPSPVASPLVDACIECGFCESNCPSRDVTLTPRQRITSFREMSRLEGLDSRNGAEDERCAVI